MSPRDNIPFEILHDVATDPSKKTNNFTLQTNVSWGSQKVIISKAIYQSNHNSIAAE